MVGPEIGNELLATDLLLLLLSGQAKTNALFSNPTTPLSVLESGMRWEEHRFHSAGGGEEGRGSLRARTTSPGAAGGFLQPLPLLWDSRGAPGSCVPCGTGVAHHPGLSTTLITSAAGGGWWLLGSFCTIPGAPPGHIHCISSSVFAPPATQSLWLVCQGRWLQEMLGLGRAEGSVTFLFHYSMLLSHVPASSCDGIQLFLFLEVKVLCMSKRVVG